MAGQEEERLSDGAREETSNFRSLVRLEKPVEILRDSARHSGTAKSTILALLAGWLVG